MPITAGRMVCGVGLGLLDSEFMGSELAQGMDGFFSFFCVVLSCVVSGFASG
jgi:hypothetical protein